MRGFALVLAAGLTAPSPSWTSRVARAVIPAGVAVPVVRPLSDVVSAPVTGPSLSFSAPAPAPEASPLVVLLLAPADAPTPDAAL